MVGGAYKWSIKLTHYELYYLNTIALLMEQALV